MFKQNKWWILGSSLPIAPILIIGCGVGDNLTSTDAGGPSFGIVERIAGLDALASTERRVYVGNNGFVGMTIPPSAKMSIHFRLSDARKKNDDGAIGQLLHALPDEIAALDLAVGNLIAADNDFVLIETESIAATGLGVLTRVEIVELRICAVSVPLGIKGILDDVAYDGINQKRLAAVKANVDLMCTELAGIIAALGPPPPVP